MTTNKLNIIESGLDKGKSRDLIIQLLNHQIAHYKKQHLADWMKDHSVSYQTTEDKIESLRAEKEEIEAFFKEYPDGDALMDVSISIEVKVKEEARKSYLKMA